jgi:hypothetical protein
LKNFTSQKVEEERLIQKIRAEVESKAHLKTSLRSKAAKSKYGAGQRKSKSQQPKYFKLKNSYIVSSLAQKPAQALADKDDEPQPRELT